MSMRDGESVPVPVDIDRPEAVLAGLTGRHLARLGALAAVLALAYAAMRAVMPVLAFVAGASPVVVVIVVIVVGRHDGTPLEQLARAWASFVRAPRRLVTGDTTPTPVWVDGGGALPAPLRLPAHAITAGGVVELGRDGYVVVTACRPVSFALATDEEQDQAIEAFARLLHGLDGPVQVLVRRRRVDLAPAITRIHDQAPGLAHPALEAAAREHAAFLADIATRADLSERQVLLAVRATTPDGAVQAAQQAAAALAGAGVTAHSLGPDEVVDVLTSCCDPTAPPGAAGGDPGDPITYVPPDGTAAQGAAREEECL